MRICIRPDSEPRREIDITRRLVAVVAEELWLACGGNDQLNWLEAEMHVAAFAVAGPRTAYGVERDVKAAMAGVCCTSLWIGGMRGNRCRDGVVRALESVAGVREVEVSLYRSRAEVAHGETCRVASLVRAIRAAGYEASLCGPGVEGTGAASRRKKRKGAASWRSSRPR